jgi:ABC-type sugar transport system ATPase subunit
MSANDGLVVSGVSKSYGATRALINVNLEIPQGRIVALIGHNGAGKSTLLRTLSGAKRRTRAELLSTAARSVLPRPLTRLLPVSLASIRS